MNPLKSNLPEKTRPKVDKFDDMRRQSQKRRLTEIQRNIRIHADMARKMSYPEAGQTKLYSMLITNDAQMVIGSEESLLAGPSKLHSQTWKVNTDKHTVRTLTFHGRTYSLTSDLKTQLSKVTKTTETFFLPQSYTPKVQIATKVLPGQCPKRLAIERERRRYASTNLEELLEQKYGIRTEDLMPLASWQDEPVLLHEDPNNPFPFPSFLPLHLFDDEDLDPRNTWEWMEMGWERKEKEQWPVPAKALLPTNDEDFGKDPTDPSITYAWCDVGVMDYDAIPQLWLVHRCDSAGRILDPRGNEIPKTLMVDDEGRRILHSNETWIPRIRVLFKAENPDVFAQRIAGAFQRRLEAEAAIRYELYVDNMPMDGIEDVPKASWTRIHRFVMSTPGIYRHPGLVDVLMARMEKEVKIDYKRAMNRQTLDLVVQKDPVGFNYITVPKSTFDVPVPETARCPDVPKYPYDDVRYEFNFKYTMTPFVEASAAMVKVRHECNRVAHHMSLFALPTSKPMKLEEFEQAQSNASAQVSLYLKDSWISAIRNSIKGTMMTAGKGWYNLEQQNFHIYQQSPFKKFMETVKFMMQDSMRQLVQDSLATFTQVMIDACHSMIPIVASQFVWGDNLIDSPFKPKRLALFSMELVIDAESVHFSTKLERYEEVLVSLFDKAIMATHGVPQLEKFVMESVQMWGLPLLEAVGKREPQIVDLRDTVRLMIRQALIPTQAYAREYERYKPLFDLDIKKYITELQNKQHTAQTIGKLVQEHLDDHTELMEDVPPNITIGPFFINSDNVKQLLLKKHKAICQALLELLALELKVLADEAGDVMKGISRKLFDKPPCIEEVVEMRDWIRTIPEKVKEHQEVMVKLREEHEILDHFMFSLSNDDFLIKWEALSWPYKIEQLIEKTLQNLEEDEDRFKKLQEHDHNAFEERLSNVTIQVAAMQNYEDIHRAHEFANECRRVNKNLRECQQLAFTYNNRERIFGMAITNYDRINKLMKEFEPFRNLWVTTSDWLRWSEGWMNDPLININPEDVERNVNEAYKIMHKSVKIFHESPAVQAIALEIKGLIEDFKPKVPLIQGLRNPGMKDRHWSMITNETGIKILPKPNLTFAKCLDMGLMDHVETIATTAEVAGKEYAIELALDKMEKEWQNIYFDIQPYKNTGTYIQKTTDETGQQLDDHIVMTQSMSFSPYKAVFEQRLTTWEETLRVTQDVIDEWNTVQRAWMYLEPIFSSDDITRQLPTESRRYQTMERIWHKIMKKANKERKVIELCPQPGLLKNLQECNELLELVQKGLSEYLETKRNSFPRFYFLSDDELLEILSQTRDPTAVQPHLRKCFENIYRLRFEDDLKITKMFSGEGEVVDLREVLYPVGNVEDWMSEIERIMRESVRLIIKDALEDYKVKPRPEWVLSWPGQVVIAGCQTYWSAEVAEAIEKQCLNERFEVLLKQLDDLRNLVRQKLTSIGRMTLSALIVIEVHARDVVANILKENVTSSNAFEWIAQLRYYWMSDQNLYQRAVNAQFPYGYEYLGNTLRLVITPLTDRCYLTLTGALHLKFGGAPAGPAGTGKTETTKDLGKAFAIQCVVFNCSDQLDVMAMGKFFKGLASSGAWACFDEFNRIDIEVLSVVAQQVTTIQKAQEQKAERFIFEGVELRLRMSCAVFITMNPGYAGRTELPDNLKALFRPVAMMVPDYALIAEISLFSFGFADAKVLSKKIVTTFKLSSEQLSSQDHYDFGMRAVKSVISAAGNLKRQNPDMNEELIALRAIRDVNVPKFLADDLKLFRGIVSDLFPAISALAEQPIDYGNLDTALRDTCIKCGLKDVEGFLNKCIQLFETTIVRHGLMLVGPTVSGKTKCYEVLQKAMTSLKGEMSPSGLAFEAVHAYVLNPKSITMGQLYGEFDPITYEWTDGILPSLIRVGAASETKEKYWYMFDGPVDAVWIENMNTVLDDNKKLCLTSGEIIKLTEPMTMMFEVADLAVASPATVSRCGMIYLEPSGLGLWPFVECWLKKLPTLIQPFAAKLEKLYAFFMEPAVKLLRSNLREIVGTVDGGLVFSLLKLMDAFFVPFNPKEGDKPAKGELIALLPVLIEPYFIFSLIWSIGATCDNDSRIKFSEWMRGRMKEFGCKMQFPAEGLVYDYRLDDGLGGSGGGDEEEEEEERSAGWRNWLWGTPKYNVTPDMKYSDILVPTIDTVRSAFVIGLLVESKKPLLCVGPTGTGKTLTIADKLLKNLPKQYIPDFIVFSAKTSANQTQDLIDGKLDKRRKGVFGPPLGKYFVFFIDDLNMPAREVYGAQPPIELIRQYMDFKGWYDRRSVGDFKNLVDVNFMGAMGPPGGGRNPVTPRLTRHFNYLAFTEMEDPSKRKIFAIILKSWIDRSPDIAHLCMQMVNTCIDTYTIIIKALLPTPAKSHYTFNLRDLSKVFQGMLMADINEILTPSQLLGLWYHENCRVFQDRLVNDEDRDWFEGLLGEKMKEFGLNIEEVILKKPFIFCDFASGAMGEEKPYIYIDDHNLLVKTLEEVMEDYNQVSTAPMRLVLFMDAIKHVCRITRIIRQPLGNALLLGMGGSGRQSLTRLASHASEFDLFQIELSKNYGTTEWRDDLKSVMMKAGLDNTPVVFLFSDTQIKSESFLEDINNILNAGDVPNIYAFEETEKIFKAMKPVVAELNQPPTKTNLFSAYTKLVRNNLHTVITMSPLGEIFRARLRQFPALVNCCTIDWFSEWPPEALQSVAMRYLSDVPELDCSQEVLNGLVSVCQEMQTSVSRFSTRFLTEMSRYNYVTPTSYLELIGIFSKLIGMKREELIVQKKRLQAGLNKLLTTSEEVAVMQVELAEMSPQLEEAVKEAEETMVQIAADTKVAEETKKSVQAQKTEATKKAREAEAIATDAQKDLDEAMPALEAALASLRSLNKNDVTEVKSLQNPPAGVRLVMESVCIMKQVKPKKVAGEKPGQKIDDYWEPGKGLLQDPGKFLESLFTFDKDNIPESVIKTIQPYIDNPNFTPEAISKVSKACTSICQWVRAMYTYYFVAKAVAPKRAALAKANAELEETQKVLGEAMEQLHTIEKGLAKLQKTYTACVNRKQDLENKCRQCEARLIRADKLIGGLAGEKDRWIDTVALLEDKVTKVVGDVLISAGCIAYQGPFTGDYRAQMVDYWVGELDAAGVPRTAKPSLVGTMGDPVKIRAWQICGLPKDNLSVENGVIAKFSRRWCLFIDPQGQANKWVKNLEKENGIDVIKLSDKDFLRSLENAVRFGKPSVLENVGTELDPALEPILLRLTFKQGGSIVMKLGESVIPYHNDFRFYITTKLPNPHYTPEISTKVTLVNFTLSPSGLQDQLLGMVVAEERPDLEDMKNQLIISNAQMKADLKEIEDKILYKLSTSEGSPVDDVDLIATLEASSITSAEIKTKVKTAEETEKTIDHTRLEYVPVAVNTMILFFCVADMSKIDPMYQYSLDWFVAIFIQSIRKAEKAHDVRERIENINSYFTFSLYCNVCRSLFEKHKLLFAFLLCSRLNQHHGIINMDEYRHFVAGGAQKPKERPNPAAEWISERSWNEILSLDLLENFQKMDFVEKFGEHVKGFKKIFDSLEPHREELPGRWKRDLSDFQKMLVLRALRLDKVTNAMQDYVAEYLGQRFIEPQDTVLEEVFSESSPTTPLIFVLSTGTDPALALYKLAEERKMSKKLSAISLGQGQGPLAEALMRTAMMEGKWVFFQNCHLAPSWMPTLESLVEHIDPTKVHREFRLWLTSMPSAKFPVFILQNGSKMTVEPPKGIKANLLRSYSSFTDDFLRSLGEQKTPFFKNLLFSLCLFHGVLIERRKFGALGFNIPYEFTDGDLRICISQLKMFLLEYSDIPYKVLKYTAGHINYGGRVTDDWDRRCMMNVLDDFYCPVVLKEQYSYSPSNIYHTLDHTSDIYEYLAYLRCLPINDTPEIFGLHDNANITFAQNETRMLLDALTELQPKTGGGGGKSREEVMEETAKSILADIPHPISIKDVVEKYPVMYEQSMNTVLAQEVIRYNKLLTIIHQSLQDLLKALKGLVVMSQELENMANSLYVNAVPAMWAGKAYPSLKPLGSWVVDLGLRMNFVHEWIDTGIPKVFWISGFFFPQAFLTGTLQNYARKYHIPIDTISFDFKVLKTHWQEVTTAPDDGCYIRGLFVEGARWSMADMVLVESRPKELFTDMPAFWLIPASNRQTPKTGVYECPLYKTLTRAGTLSTTGHSTNFVFTVEVPSDKTQQHWIKRGVAMLCALNY